MTSTQWTVYSAGTKRVQYNSVPTRTITAESVTVDGDVDFQPEYDADGNQTRVRTGTGIWTVSYDAENRPKDFTSQAADGTITSVHCEYDYMGRRTTKMVTVGNNVTLHQRYIYRGYLQIACIDLTRSHHPALWFITWDPTQPVATRPLAIQKDGSWFTYGWDLTKNICELYGPAGYIRTAYTYAPYGEVTAEGDISQPIQWSSEYFDNELVLLYYNYRTFNMKDGRWICRDMAKEHSSINVYAYGNGVFNVDLLGLSVIPRHTPITSITVKRNDILWISIIAGDMLKAVDTESKDTYGHWWIEFGDESYGWWPKNGVSSLRETVKGVDGKLNGMYEDASPTQDDHHGESAHYSFHPMLYVGNLFSTFMHYGVGKGKKCTCVNEDEIKDCLRTFAKSYSGTWSYPTGQNCHSFQTQMMDNCCLREPRF